MPFPAQVALVSGHVRGLGLPPPQCASLSACPRACVPIHACASLSRCPKALVPFRTIVSVPPGTNAMVSCPVRGPGFPPSQRRFVPPSPEGSGFSPRHARSPSSVRGPRSVPARCASIRLRPRASVSVRTACWVLPTQARWFSQASEDASFRLRNGAPLFLRPRVWDPLCTVRFHLPSSEDSGRLERVARSSVSARRRRFPTARRAGLGLYRVALVLRSVRGRSAFPPRRRTSGWTSEDARSCERHALSLPSPEGLGRSGAVRGSSPASEDASYLPHRLPDGYGRGQSRCPGTEVPWRARASRGPGRGRSLRRSPSPAAKAACVAS
jgi:hypothetical protein